MSRSSPALHIDFAGEAYEVTPGTRFTIGRSGDLAIDDNPYLHRSFLAIEYVDNLWWVHNIGARLAVQLTDEAGLMKAVLAPGAGAPIVFGVSLLVFEAGSTTYELELCTEVTSYEVIGRPVVAGETTQGSIDFTDSQLLAILALAEPALRNPGGGSVLLPTSAQAAKRLGWTLTRFNRKLDNVCDKLERAGVAGVHGTVQAGASNRRTRLVDYALSTLLVTADDLPKLRVEAGRNASSGRRQ